MIETKTDRHSPARPTLVTTYAYGPSGRVQDVTDPRGITARTLYDALGRTTATIANYTGAAPGTQADVNTLFSFDSTGRLASRTAVQPTGLPTQVTQDLSRQATGKTGKGQA